MPWWRRRALSDPYEHADEVMVLARALADDLELFAGRGRPPSHAVVEAARLLAAVASASAPRRAVPVNVQLVAAELEEGLARLAWSMMDAHRRSRGVGAEHLELLALASQKAEQVVDALRSEGAGQG